MPRPTFAETTLATALAAFTDADSPEHIATHLRAASAALLEHADRLDVTAGRARPPHTWADAWGVWHVRLSDDNPQPEATAAGLIGAELRARGDWRGDGGQYVIRVGLASSGSVEQVPGTVVYREV